MDWYGLDNSIKLISGESSSNSENVSKTEFQQSVCFVSLDDIHIDAGAEPDGTDSRKFCLLTDINGAVSFFL